MRLSTVLRLGSWVFSIIIFSVMVNQVTHHGCPMRDHNGCTVAVIFSSISLLTVMMVSYFDYSIGNQENTYAKRQFVICDLISSSLLAITWLSLFIYFASVLYPHPDSDVTAAFGFFSAMSWAGQTYLAYKNFQSVEYYYFAGMIIDNATVRRYAPQSTGATIVQNSALYKAPFSDEDPTN